ncbi:MAG: hypothetical protein JWO82_249 [Akkermansiaceae bacterium]|nr:hypothetical protein [Akkermansiaceae bacterium]
MKTLKLLMLAVLAFMIPLHAVPMPNPAVITANDSYDITGVARGKTQDLILKGTFGGATVALQYLNQATGAWDTVQSWTGAIDYVHLAQGTTARITVTGGTAMSINVAFFPADPLAKNRPGTFSSITSTGPVQATRYLADDNTAATPAYSFTSEPNSGLYRSATNDFRFSVAGTDVVRVNLGGFATTNGILGSSQANGISLRPSGVGDTTGAATITPAGSFQATAINATPLGATTPSTGAFTTVSASGITTITNATASTTTGTGALVVTGGAGVGGAGMFGGTVSAPGLSVGVSGQIGFTSSGGLRRNADGDFSLRNAANSANGNLTAASVTLSAITDTGKTITAAGTTGAKTINGTSGTVNFAAGASSLVLTNSSVTTNSIVIPVARTNDASARDLRAVPAAGSCTFFWAVAPAAETSVGWVVFN